MQTTKQLQDDLQELVIGAIKDGLIDPDPRIRKSYLDVLAKTPLLSKILLDAFTEVDSLLTEADIIFIEPAE